MSEISALSDEWLEATLDGDPLESTLLGYPGRDAALADLSVEFEEHQAERLTSIRYRAEAIHPNTLDPEDQITRAVIIALHDGAIDSRSAGTVEFTVAAFPVSPASVLLSYLRMVPVTTDQQARDYVQRLSAIPEQLEQALERLHMGRQSGLVPVRRLTEASIAQIDAFLADPIAVLGVSAGPDVANPEAWARRRDTVIRGIVAPAFEEYRKALVRSVLPTSRADDEPGLAHLPGGRERDSHLIRLHTTTGLTAEELHDAGLRTISEVHREFEVVGDEVLGTSDLVEILSRLRDDRTLRWETADQILDAAEAAVRRAESVAPEWFGRIPATPCALAAIPDVESAGAAPAYYMPPTIDGSRPGTYYSNVSNPTDRSSFDLEAVAFHEAVPGHHFQIALALENQDTPPLRRLPLFTAYIEGWGLYSERLADEMGLYSSPLQRLGMLSADAWRAARLVIDTGLHHFGWSRQQAVDYLTDNTAVAPIDVESEIDRYIAYPGQALSYMTGRREMQRLRDRASTALGDRFSVSDFHDRLLAHGALPLTVLDTTMAQWQESVPS
jgi:uncharacterized protein (DUF885 family)